MLDLLLRAEDRRALERLRPRYPALRVTAAGAEIPLGDGTAEEVLAACRAEGIRICRSLVKSPPPG
ncbi:MAG: hypothetical protein ACREMO_01765 [Gemmatimonadales bacterium]